MIPRLGIRQVFRRPVFIVVAAKPTARSFRPGALRIAARGWVSSRRVKVEAPLMGTVAGRHRSAERAKLGYFIRYPVLCGILPRISP